MNGDTLQRHRRAAGLTQHELAERVNTTQPQVCRWERSGAYDVRTISRLAEALGLPVRVLLMDTIDGAV